MRSPGLGQQHLLAQLLDVRRVVLLLRQATARRVDGDGMAQAGEGQGGIAGSPGRTSTTTDAWLRLHHRHRPLWRLVGRQAQADAVFGQRGCAVDGRSAH